MIIVSLDNSSKLCTLPIPEGPDLIGVGGVGLVGEYSDLTGLPYSESFGSGFGSSLIFDTSGSFFGSIGAVIV